MQNIQLYNFTELLALVISVLIGTGAYLGFVVLKKNQRANGKFIFWVLIINLFVTYLFSEALKIFKWGEYRTLILPLVAYAGQYLMDWLDKRYLRIFDAGAGKIGLNINKDNNNNEELNELPVEQENIENNEEL